MEAETDEIQKLADSKSTELSIQMDKITKEIEVLFLGQIQRRAVLKLILMGRISGLNTLNARICPMPKSKEKFDLICQVGMKRNWTRRIVRKCLIVW